MSSAGHSYDSNTSIVCWMWRKAKQAFFGEYFFFLNDSSYYNCLTIIKWQFMDCNRVIQDQLVVICLFTSGGVPAVPGAVTKVLEPFTRGDMPPGTLLQLVQQTWCWHWYVFTQNRDRLIIRPCLIFRCATRASHFSESSGINLPLLNWLITVLRG